MSSLTRHPSGSFKELFVISIPLVLSLFSASLMMFLDRLILSQYSLEAMNGASAASNWAWVFTVFGLGVSSIAEVFVGHYNGAQKYEKVASPVWQMLWFSLGIGLLFFGVGELAPLLLPKDPLLYPISKSYYQWVLYFGFFFVGQAALGSFFIGIGKVRRVLEAALIANLVNLILDLLLVFGIKGYLAPMGARGAAIATGIASMAQFLILLFSFLKAPKQYRTHDYSFHYPEFVRCIRVGLPSALGRTFENIAWAFIVSLLASVSTVHITLMTIGQSLYLLLFFYTEGLQKGVIAIGANLLGAHKMDMIPFLQKSAYKMIGLFGSLFAIPLLFYPQTIAQFFCSDSVLSFFDVQLTLFGVWLYFIIDCIAWTHAGLLTAAKDTRFVMNLGAISSWLCAALPIYFFLVILKVPAYCTWYILDGYVLINAICFYLRYQRGKWKKIHLHLQ